MANNLIKIRLLIIAINVYVQNTFFIHPASHDSKKTKKKNKLIFKF